MPITLTLKEKCYLVALFGDMPMARREELFQHSSLPAQAGPAVMQAGYDFVGELNSGRVLVRKRGTHPALYETGRMKRVRRKRKIASRTN